MLTNELTELASTEHRPDGSSCRTLALADARRLSHHHAMPLKEVEIAALQLEIIPARYSRNSRTLSAQDQLKLLQTHAAIIGLGGLGGAVADLMARLGVGELTLVDGDIFEETNLNRQLLATTSRLGRAKVEVAEEHILDINPATAVRGFREFFTNDNGNRILEGVQLVIDCLDTIDARFCLEACCAPLQLPIVSAAVAGTCGQATVIFPGDAGYSRIYGNRSGDHGHNTGRGSEATLGTLGFAAHQLAAHQCAEALAVMLNRNAPLRNRLCLVDAADHTTELMELN